jgi:hypothetical protein
LARIEEPTPAQNVALVIGITALARAGVEVAVRTPAAPQIVPRQFKRRGIALTGTTITIGGVP